LLLLGDFFVDDLTDGLRVLHQRFLGLHNGILVVALECFAQVLVEGDGAHGAAVHGRQHLHIVERVEAEALADYLRALVAGDMEIESVQLGRDQQREGVVIVRGRLLKPSENLFPRWMEALGKEGYTPLLRPQEGRDKEMVALHVIAGVAPEAHPRVWINILLFALTVLSTLFVGAQYADANANLQSAGDLFLPQNFIKGWPFALTLLSILGAHEFGHYFAARFHRVAVTLPYFIPAPMPPFGTLGAVIVMRAPPKNRRHLFQMAVAGPLGGLILAIPFLFIGLSQSTVAPLPPPPYVLEGNSIFYLLAKWLVFHQWLPSGGMDVQLHNIAFAAWVGLFITGLNLIPAGQLDGGHIVYTLFGKKVKYLSYAVVGVFLLLSIKYPGWLLWTALIFFLGRIYAMPMDDLTPLPRKYKWLGYFMLLLLVLMFTPLPIQLIQ